MEFVRIDGMSWENDRQEDGKGFTTTRAAAAVRAVGALTSVTRLGIGGRVVGIVPSGDTMAIEVAGELTVRARHLF